MVKLWMLAGRLPNGYKQVAGCIADYAKSKSLALVQQNHPNPGSSTVTTAHVASSTTKPRSSPINSGGAATTNNQSSMIADLLELQQQVNRLVNKLPHGTDHTALKPVWEEIVNTTPSIAESLAKLVDQIMK